MFGLHVCPRCIRGKHDDADDDAQGNDYYDYDDGMKRFEAVRSAAEESSIKHKFKSIYMYIYIYRQKEREMEWSTICELIF